MKNWIRDILLVGAGFAAGAYFMHVRMREEYQKFADAQIEDVREHYKKKEQHIDEQIKAEAQKQAVDLISGPYRQESDPEKQYRDLAGQTNVREDDPNKELKLERERLQLQKDVKSLKKEINGGQTFVKTVFTNASQQALTKMATGAMLYAGKKTVMSIFNNPDLANAVGTGSLDKEKKDDK